MNNSKNLSDIETARVKDEAARANRDPITSTPGAHPVGTALGGASGAVAGVIVGTAVAGPVGAVVGAVVGVVAGGLAGKGAGEAVNPTEEDTYWRSHYKLEPYYVIGSAYDDYAPAYRTGYEYRKEQPGQTFEEIEIDMKRRYDVARGTSTLAWEQARAASRAAWLRAERHPSA